MTIKIGTIQEMTGEGFEILVDSETRSYVLAKFFDGNFLDVADPNIRVNGLDKTIINS
jgi:hypothetical protein